MRAIIHEGQPALQCGCGKTIGMATVPDEMQYVCGCGRSLATSIDPTQAVKALAARVEALEHNAKAALPVEQATWAVGERAPHPLSSKWPDPLAPPPIVVRVQIATGGPVVVMYWDPTQTLPDTSDGNPHRVYADPLTGYVGSEERPGGREVGRLVGLVKQSAGDVCKWVKCHVCSMPTSSAGLTYFARGHAPAGLAENVPICVECVRRTAPGPLTELTFSLHVSVPDGSPAGSAEAAGAWLYTFLRGAHESGPPSAPPYIKDLACRNDGQLRAQVVTVTLLRKVGP